MRNNTSPLTKYLGKEVELTIDRPLGSRHPEHNFIYKVNYGYLPGTKAPDGEEIDAYFLGLKKPVKKASGICIAIIHRKYDNDDKLVIASKQARKMSKKEISDAVAFQEKWFNFVILK